MAEWDAAGLADVAKQVGRVRRIVNQKVENVLAGQRDRLVSVSGSETR